MKVQDIQTLIESIAHLQLQESYDNSGLLVGNSQDEINGVLITLDVTEEVIDEAIKTQVNCIVTHHPLIFKGIKKLTSANEVERCIIKAIKNNIAIYCAHTNLDNASEGVNRKIANLIGLENQRILQPKADTLVKIVTFVPADFADVVRAAITEAGAGKIGNYEACTFNSQGEGTFRALENANPFVGSFGELHKETEVKIESIVPKYSVNLVLAALKMAHPYEEPAFDIIPLENTNPYVGSGMIGELPEEENVQEFLKRIKSTFKVESLRFTESNKNTVKKVAVCGGSGSFLISQAQRAKADIFITGDVKYHDFFISENKMIIADIGHYESEQFTKELFYETIKEKFPKFAVHLSMVNTNPIKYL